MPDESDLTDRQREYLDALPADSLAAWGEAVGVSKTGAESARDRLNEHPDIDIRYDGEWRNHGGDLTQTAPWEDTAVAEEDPSEADLTERERYIAQKLQTGATPAELADDIGTRETVVHQHLRDLRASGWAVYRDETAGLVALEGDHALRSSEHKGTRTRKANRWWEQRHSALVRDFKSLETPTADELVGTGDEDWVHILTDVHAGDKVHTPDGTNVYNTADTVARIIEYDTRKSLELAEYHGADYGTALLGWLGDFLTNEGIYQGQFEDLDAWLDEQHNAMMEPLLGQVKAYSERFDRVVVVCHPGNHGQHRASGTSKQANADLVLYKSVRNAIAAIRKHGDDAILDNVEFHIGQARPYTNYYLRDGNIKIHLRHGQDRPPQATTRAGSDDWKTTLLNHEFDVAAMGHHHVSGKVAWDGPPVFIVGTPKPPSDFVDRIAAATSLDPRERSRKISQCFGVADHGVTGEYSVKTHDFDYLGGR